MSSDRPYQGFPYVNPPVTDAPSLSSEEVAALRKWRDLPTRKVTTQPPQDEQKQQKKNDQPVSINITEAEVTNDSLYPHYPSKKHQNPKKNTKAPDPVVYIDLHGDNFSDSSVNATGVNVASRVNNTGVVKVAQRVNKASVVKDPSGANVASKAKVASEMNNTNINDSRETNDACGINSASNYSNEVNSQKVATTKLNEVKKGSAGYKDDDEIEPVIYIDIPDSNVESNSASNNSSGVNNARVATTSGVKGIGVKEGSSSSGNEDNDEIEPVVYIDIPDSNESNVSQNRLAHTEAEPDFVQETIFYDPFEERMIHDRKTPSGSQPGSSQTHRPPTTLNLTSVGTSSGETPGLPAFLSKEAYVYGRQATPDDGFRLSPIPLDKFSQPPPSYEEASRTPQTTPSHREDNTPPRTQVIVHYPENNVVGQADLNRMFVCCQHCGKQVNTLVVRKAGLLTHAIAWSFMICCLFPITIGIYFIDLFKYRNHYCPNCNKEIGHELCCLGMRYADKE